MLQLVPMCTVIPYDSASVTSAQLILQHKTSLYDKTLQLVVSCIVYSTAIGVCKSRNL